MRRNGGIFKLMSRQLGDDDGVVIQLVHNIEEGYADIAGQKSVAAAVGQNMVYQRRRGAFAFGAGDANSLVMELAEEQVGLRGDLNALGIEVLQRNARCLDDDVVVVHGLQIACAKMLHSLHLVFVGHSDVGIGQVFIQETQCRPSLAPEAEDEDAFAA